MWAGFPNYSLEGKGINIVINWLTGIVILGNTCGYISQDEGG